MIKSKITPEHQSRFRARLKEIAGQHRRMRKSWKSRATGEATQKPISAQWLSHCINRFLEEDTILVTEVVSDSVAVGQQIERSKPGTLFANGGANLGWGLGASLGAKLAAPDKTVISLISDGSFIFGCPIAALWASRNHAAPFLSVIYNNQKYKAARQAVGDLYGEDSSCEKNEMWPGCDISPSPDYALIARSCGAHGRTVDDPSQILPALQEAMEQVTHGMTAVVDVRIQ
jgi:acetolactate synthase-1/2/3 large subunit